MKSGIKHDKVAVYLPFGEPFSPHRGGALAKWTYEVYKRLHGSVDALVLANDDQEPYLYPPVETCAPNPLCTRISDQIRYRRLFGAIDAIKPFFRQSHARHAAKICRRLNAAVIHIHNDPEAVMPIRRLNPASVIVLHMNNDHLIEGESARAASAAVSAADWIFFCSHYLMIGALERVKNLPSNRSFVIENGSRLFAEPPIISNSFKAGSTPVILFVGRIVPEKGLHVLLHAMHQVIKRFPEAVLRIVGGIKFGSSEEDSYLADLRQQAISLGHRVEFLGSVPHSGVVQHFQAADVFVCPSLWNEPFGMVNVEAMGTGVPLVAFRKGGIPEVVGDAGLLLDDSTPATLATAIIHLLEQDGLRRQLSLCGQKRVAECYSWDVIARKWQSRLASWMAGGRGV